MTVEQRSEKSTERGTKPLETRLIVQVVKISVLLCLATLLLCVLPEREDHKIDYPIEGASLSIEILRDLRLSRAGEATESRTPAVSAPITGWRGNELFQRQQFAGPWKEVTAHTPRGVGENDEESIETLERTVLTATKPAARLDAVEALTQTNEPDQAGQVLSQVVIIDRNSEVRLAALDALDDIDEVPFETLAQVVVRDSDAILRQRALELIGELKENNRWVVELLVQVARIDPSNDVRQLAASILETVRRGH